MKVVSVTLCSCLIVSLAVGQFGRPPFRGRPLRPANQSGQALIATQDTVRLLALMVQFKSDLEPRTSGDGSFNLSGSSEQIDPPPHDSAFVVNKLRFVKNYFQKVSNGALIVEGEVFTPSITLADSMAAYSPLRAGSDQPLGQLIVDSWTAADAANPGFPFSAFDAFVIVHAGIGHDINVVSLLGYDPTPFDIPSLFVNLASLRLLLNDPGYAGVPVSGGAFAINNTIILPESESRVFGSGNLSDTLQLSTNGLLAASVGSYLGLPDLFDTRTGRSGIGQFGLMDGAAIFAFNGLFPPEPSAWEKVALGWVTPFEGTGTMTIPAVGLTTAGEDSILKIPITASEYFLLENRSRDANGDGQTLTIVKNGVEFTRSFASDTTGFFFRDVSAITGSVVDVEDFDWAISGDASQPGLEGGGVLIWHIDESVIAANSPTNTVNADPAHRGVDLEEADGSQDIGELYDFVEPGSGTEVGWPLDQWFSGNFTPTYRNAFDATSFPDSRSNSGALSNIAVRNFSAKSPRMSLQVEVGSPGFQPLNGLTRTFGPTSQTLAATATSNAVVVASDKRVFVYQKTGTSKVVDPQGMLSASGGSFPLAALEGIKTFLVGAEDSTVFIWDLDTTTAGVSASISLNQVLLDNPVTAPPMIVDSAGTPIIAVGTADGSVWSIELAGTVREKRNVGTSAPVSGFVANPGTPGSFFSVSQNTLSLGTAGVSLPVAAQGWMISGGNVPGGVMVVAAEKSGRRILGFDGSLTPRFSVLIPDGAVSGLVVADADNDGINDVVVSAGSGVFAFNRIGILLDHFPIRLTDGIRFTGTPLVLDINGDGLRDVVCLSTSGALHAFDRTGRQLTGFPFQIAPPGMGALAAFETTTNEIGLLSTAESGSMSAWGRNLPYGPGPGDWLGFLSDAAHLNFNTGPVSVPGIPVSGFLPKERVYNWPNPVYGPTTNIRFFTTEPASIVIRIFDLAGESITELKGDSPGGVDSEIIWNVRDIHSGIYLAHVEAASGGRKDVVIVKIAVVK